MTIDRRGFLPGQYAIDGYGAGGFRFAEMSHQGSILALPSGMHAWPIVQFDGLPVEAFDKVFAEADQIELFLFGCGQEMRIASAAIKQAFAAHGIAFDSMPTAAAARTYNVLVAERRRVAAGLIAVT